MSDPDIAASVTSASPNGLAFSQELNGFFLASYTGLAGGSKLAFFNMSDNITTTLGVLAEAAGNAAMHQGAYWYVGQRSDHLRRVVVDMASLTITSDILVASMTNGTRQLDFGDIDFDASGLLYLTAQQFDPAQRRDTQRMLATYDIAQNIFDVVRIGPSADSSVAYLGQVAAGPGGSLFVQDGYNGAVYAINKSTGALLSTAPLLASHVFTDLASGIICGAG